MVPRESNQSSDRRAGGTVGEFEFVVFKSSVSASKLFSELLQTSYNGLTWKLSLGLRSPVNIETSEAALNISSRMWSICPSGIEARSVSSSRKQLVRCGVFSP